MLNPYFGKCQQTARVSRIAVVVMYSRSPDEEGAHTIVMPRTRTKQPRVGPRFPNGSFSNPSKPARVKRAVAKRKVRQPSQNGKQEMPAAFTSVRTTRGPRLASANGCVRISHRELVHKYGSAGTGFQDKFFYVNAGLGPSGDSTSISGVFPWLSTIANAFERYKFKRLRFEYEPTCGTTEPGTYAMAVDYGITDAQPASLAALSAYIGATHGNVYRPMTMSVQGASGQEKKLLTRAAAWATGTSRQDYDLCVLNLCSDDVASTKGGNIYVDYEVELYLPQ